MIIRVNFNDNDFGSYFEEFFRQFKFVNYYENVRQLRDKDDEKSLREYRDKKIDMEELYEKVFYKPDDLTVIEKKRFSKYVKESILAYLSSRVDKDVLHYLDINFYAFFGPFFEIHFAILKNSLNSFDRHLFSYD